MEILSSIVIGVFIILSLILLIAVIKNNYFFYKIFKPKQDSSLAQNDDLKYLDGRMSGTGAPDVSMGNHYKNSISAPLKPKND